MFKPEGCSFNTVKCFLMNNSKVCVCVQMYVCVQLSVYIDKCIMCMHVCVCSYVESIGQPHLPILRSISFLIL